MPRAKVGSGESSNRIDWSKNSSDAVRFAHQHPTQCLKQGFTDSLLPSVIPANETRIFEGGNREMAMHWIVVSTEAACPSLLFSSSSHLPLLSWNTVNSVFVLVTLSLMRCVGVIVSAVVSCVIVAVRTLLFAVFVRVFVFVPVFVNVGVRMFVAVNRVSVDVIVTVSMGVLVGVQMLVLVIAFHISLLSLGLGFVGRLASLSID